jgi:hypothetical protein
MTEPTLTSIFFNTTRSSQKDTILTLCGEEADRQQSCGIEEDEGVLGVYGGYGGGAQRVRE